MSTPQSPYRERALEQGDVREALDERVRVVSVPRWIALVVALLLIVGLLAWSASKEVQTTIDAQGVISLPGGIPHVVAPLAGVVVTPPLSPGSSVAAGEVVSKLNTGRGQPVSVTALEAGSINTAPVVLGSYVNAGDVLATIVPPGTHQPVFFLFATESEASQIRTGMSAEVTPAASVSQASVLLKCRVVSVQAIPDTASRIANVAGSALASAFDKVPSNEVVLEPTEPGHATQDGYVWHTSAGSVTFRLASRVSARIVLKQESPLSYIF
jgi:HlyD family secretion protein